MAYILDPTKEKPSLFSSQAGLQLIPGAMPNEDLGLAPAINPVTEKTTFRVPTPAALPPVSTPKAQEGAPSISVNPTADLSLNQNRGRASTLLTGPSGVNDVPTSVRRKLLGV